MGFQDIRVKVVVEGDATRAQLDDIVNTAGGQHHAQSGFVLAQPG